MPTDKNENTKKLLSSLLSTVLEPSFSLSHWSGSAACAFFFAAALVSRPVNSVAAERVVA